MDTEIILDRPIKADDRMKCHRCKKPAGQEIEAWYARADDQKVDRSGAIVLPLTCGDCYGT